MLFASTLTKAYTCSRATNLSNKQTLIHLWDILVDLKQNFINATVLNRSMCYALFLVSSMCVYNCIFEHLWIQLLNLDDRCINTRATSLLIPYFLIIERLRASGGVSQGSGVIIPIFRLFEILYIWSTIFRRRQIHLLLLLVAIHHFYHKKLEKTHLK